VLLAQTNYLPQKNQPAREKNTYTRTTTPISSGTRNSENQHKIVQEKTTSAVIENSIIHKIETFNILFI
jgi:hypothetical protein